MRLTLKSFYRKARRRDEMLLPTQDKVLRQSLIYQAVKHTPNLAIASDLVDDFLKEVEGCGYHKGLPTSIEEALSSGDGAYRP